MQRVHQPIRDRRPRQRSHAQQPGVERRHLVVRRRIRGDPAPRSECSDRRQETEITPAIVA